MPRYVRPSAYITNQDFTVAYSGASGLASERYPGASQLITGRSPSTVHVHCDIVSLQDIRGLPRLKGQTTDSAQFLEWLMQRWENKELLLAKFARQGTFASPTVTSRDDRNPESGLHKDIILNLIPRNIFGQMANQLCVLTPSLLLFYWVYTYLLA